MTLLFRAAEVADADAAVPLILSSGPDSFHYVFSPHGGPGAAAFLRAAFVDGAGEFGYRNHTVAVADGRVAGIGKSYSGANTLAYTTAAARQIVRCYGRYAPGVMLRGLRTEAVVRPPARDEWTIVHLGVAPEFRSRGVGRALVEELLRQGRAAGLKKAVLDVSVLNPRAQALYERLGFTVAAERPSTLRNAVSFVPDHRRMSRAL